MSRRRRSTYDNAVATLTRRAPRSNQSREPNPGRDRAGPGRVGPGQRAAPVGRIEPDSPRARCQLTVCLDAVDSPALDAGQQHRVRHGQGRRRRVGQRGQQRGRERASTARPAEGWRSPGHPRQLQASLEQADNNLKAAKAKLDQITVPASLSIASKHWRSRPPPSRTWSRPSRT